MAPQGNTLVGKGTADVVLLIICANSALTIFRQKSIRQKKINLLVFIFPDAMTDLDIQELATLTAGDADVDNFERLFTKLKQMKGIFKKMGKGKKRERRG